MRRRQLRLLRLWWRRRRRRWWQWWRGFAFIISGCIAAVLIKRVYKADAGVVRFMQIVQIAIAIRAVA